jgi:hypothetical protein
MVAKFLTVSTAFGAKFRQIVVLCGSLACDRGASYKSKSRGALGRMAQMAQGKSGPARPRYSPSFYQPGRHDIDGSTCCIM